MSSSDRNEGNQFAQQMEVERLNRENKATNVFNMWEWEFQRRGLLPGEGSKRARELGADLKAGVSQGTMYFPGRYGPTL